MNEENLKHVRNLISEQNTNLANTEQIFTSREETSARIDAFIESSSHILEVDVTGLALQKRGPSRIFAQGEPHQFDDQDSPNGLDLMPVMALFFKDQFKAWLMSQLDEIVGDEWGEPVAVTNEKIIIIKQQLLELECEEEAIISFLEKASNEHIPRRDGLANPLLVALKHPKILAEANL